MALAVVTDSARVPPHNVEAEKSVLGAVFIKPAAFDVVKALEVDDFFQPAHREIFEAMLTVEGRQGALDHITVSDELRARGVLSRLEGGESYLVALATAVPTAENVAHYVRIVREKATLRRLIAVAAEVQATAHGDVGAVGEFLGEALGRVERIVRSAPVSVRPAVDLVDRLVDVGDPLATGLRTLDADHHGGFRRGRRVCIGGAPGAAKTTTALTLGYDWARAGVHVAVLAADEAAPDLLVRIGQLAGLDRSALEAGEPTALDRLRAELRQLPTLTIVDGDDGGTVETAAGVLRGRPAGAPGALIIDSLQTARAAGTDEAEGPRARIDAVLGATRRASREGLVVVFTTELSRAAYRSRDPQDRVDDMAAGKESGGIEYAAQTLLVLRAVPDRVGEVDVTVAKNRGGDRRPLRLVVDFAHARVHETALPETALAPERQDAASQLTQDIIRARTVLADSPGIAGRWALAALLTGMSKDRQSAATAALWDNGEVEDRGAKRRPRWHLRSPSSPGSPLTLPGTAGTVHSPALPTPYRGGSSGESKSGESGDRAEPDGRGESSPEDPGVPF